MPQTRTPHRPDITRVELRQICYSSQTLESLPEGMLALDYTDNERPDWREYWPIRRFLLNHPLADDTLYGFFSPKFEYKTGLNAQSVNAFIHKDRCMNEVYLFSPFWDLSSFFVNVFEQGDFFHPGLKRASELFVENTGLPVHVKHQVTHSQNTVFCNYIVANKSFWLKWLSLGERLMFAAEHPEAGPQLRQILGADARYSDSSVQMKVFVMERLATLLLMHEPSLRVHAYDSFLLPPSNTPMNGFFHEAVQCNALKSAYAQSESPFNLHAFMALRDQVFQRMHAKAA